MCAQCAFWPVLVSFQCHLHIYCLSFVLFVFVLMWSCVLYRVLKLSCVFWQEGYDQAFLKDAVLERMKDDVPEVVQAALKALEVSGRDL